jgi:hypothetical protein
MLSNEGIISKDDGQSILAGLEQIEKEIAAGAFVFKRELEDITAEITNPNKENVQIIYEALSAPLRKTLDEADAGFLDLLNKETEKIKITDNDLIVDGTSIRQVAHMTCVYHTQVEKYFGLLQSATGEPIDETFEEISEEFPEAVIREIVEKIEQAIRPNYKDTKKN